MTSLPYAQCAHQKPELISLFKPILHLRRGSWRETEVLSSELLHIKGIGYPEEEVEAKPLFRVVYSKGYNFYIL